MTKTEQKQWFTNRVQWFIPFTFSQFFTILQFLLDKYPEIHVNTQCEKTQYFDFQVRVPSPRKFVVLDDDLKNLKSHSFHDSIINLHCHSYYEYCVSTPPIIRYVTGVYCDQNDTLYIHSSGSRIQQEAGSHPDDLPVGRVLGSQNAK